MPPNLPRWRFGAPKQVMLNQDAHSMLPNMYSMQAVPFDDLFLAAILQFSRCLQCTYVTVCGLWLLRRRLREAVRVKGNSPRGRRVSLGPQRKQRPHILREFLAPKKVYFNHWLNEHSVLRGFTPFTKRPCVTCVRVRVCYFNRQLPVVLLNSTSLICH